MAEKNKTTKQKTKNIFQALADFQAEKLIIPRNGVGHNGTKTYKYATLDDVIQMTRPALEKHHLVFAQLVFQNEHRQTLLKTVLVCTDDPAGERLETIIPLGNATSAQDMGSRITYMRRYALVPILGLSIEEDTDAVPPELSADTQTTNPIPVIEPEVFPPLSAESLEPAEPLDPSKKMTIDDLNTKTQEIINEVKRSEPHQNAYNRVTACKNEEALEMFKKRIRVSGLLNAAEKADLEELIKLKETELSGTVHI